MHVQKTVINEAILAEARRQQSEVVRGLFISLGRTLFKSLPDRLRRAYQRRRTLVALERLDDRTLADIGLAPGMIRRAAISAADYAYDQEMQGHVKPTFLTPAQAIKKAESVKSVKSANSNSQKKVA